MRAQVCYLYLICKGEEFDQSEMLGSPGCSVICIVVWNVVLAGIEPLEEVFKHTAVVFR